MVILSLAINVVILVLFRCTNCGADNHKSWQCQDKPNVTNSVTCTACGGNGHIAADCKSRRPGKVYFFMDEAEGNLIMPLNLTFIFFYVSVKIASYYIFV